MSSGPRTALLPRVVEWEEYRLAFRNRRIWMPAVRAILARHGYRMRGTSRILPGTAAAFLVSDPPRRVLLKIFPPFPSGDLESERAALGLVRARVPVPRAIASGVLRDRVKWQYLLLDPLPGVPLVTVARRIPAPALARIARTAGRMLRAVNAVRGHALLALPRSRRPVRPVVHAFIPRSIAALARAGAVTPGLARRLPGLLRTLTRPRGRPVLIHADLNADHVLVARTRGTWRVTGLIDFGDAYAGDPCCELMPVWLGLAGRDPAVFRAFLRGWGRGRPGHGRFDRDRAAAFVISHRFWPEGVHGFLHGRRLTSWESLRDAVLAG